MKSEKIIIGIVERGDWERLPKALDSLSNMEFRRCETLVRDEILPTLPNDRFWEAYRHFVAYRPQAFLTGITAIGNLSKQGMLNFDTSDIRALAELLSSCQKKKLLSMALPHLTNFPDLEGLFTALHVNSPSERATVLVRHASPLSYYLLFKTLRSMDDAHDLSLRCCRHILEKHDDLSYNMASILRACFDLDEIKGHLSLPLEHYELSYIELSFENFRFVLEGRRPKVF